MSAAVAGRTLPMRERIRAIVESWLPWFDRPSHDRAMAETEVELAEARKVRAHADRVISRMEAARNGYRAYGERMDR